MRTKYAACLSVLLLFGFLIFGGGGCGGGSSSTKSSGPKPTAFVPNSFKFWNNPKNYTTSYGPAYADISLASTNFLPCRGGPYALCYYSGPSPDTCNLIKNDKFGDCQCFEIPYGVYFVDINAILNHDVYQQTVAQCGADGGGCQTVNSAPVCETINKNTLIPGAQLYSTFSFDCIPENGLGQTSCGTAKYAGCMTAPCWDDGKGDGLATCQCPVYNGPYQLGVTLSTDQCTLGDSLVWSAAYAPPATPTATPTGSASPSAMTRAAATRPSPTACIPDAPGGLGCPLYTQGQMLPPGSGVDCNKVCDEYNTCTGTAGIQVGYTCDSTLCTDECNDRDLVSIACSGLSGCDISEIVKAEHAASCSCCASQLCGCTPDGPTNDAIGKLVQDQRDRNVTPQCDINGTLCGTATPQ
jgi:hypothetical protein